MRRSHEAVAEGYGVAMGEAAVRRSWNRVLIGGGPKPQHLYMLAKLGTVHVVGLSATSSVQFRSGPVHAVEGRE